MLHVEESAWNPILTSLVGGPSGRPRDPRGGLWSGSLEHCRLAALWLPAVNVLRMTYTDVEHALGLNLGSLVSTLCPMFVFCLPLSKQGQRTCCYVGFCHVDPEDQRGVYSPRHCHWESLSWMPAAKLHRSSHIWAVPGPLVHFITAAVLLAFPVGYTIEFMHSFAGLVFHECWYAKQLRLHPHWGKWITIPQKPSRDESPWWDHDVGDFSLFS